MGSRSLIASMLLAAAVAAPSRAQQYQGAEIAQANAGFAFDIYGELRKSQSGNFFYSPHSISSALGMTMAGARGQTAAEMARTLRYDALGDRVHPLAAAFGDELAKRENVRGERGDPFRLRVSNALWGQIDHEFRPEFVELLGKHYGAALRSLDFVQDPDGSRKTVNAAIEEATEGKIRDLLQPPDVTDETRLVLTNAIYFKASWAEEFPAGRTQVGAFHRKDGTAVDVPFMERTDGFLHAERDGLTAIDLPYLGGEVAMLVLMPAEGTFDEFEGSLDSKRLEAIVGSLGGRQVDLALPKFEMRSRFGLGEVLQDLGMKSAFDPDAADFSGMDGTRNLFIGAVVHQSFVRVDEKGTEAAAATAVMMETEMEPDEPIEVRIDRPFVFLVRHRTTGAVLFVGRVLDPK